MVSLKGHQKKTPFGGSPKTRHPSYIWSQTVAVCPGAACLRSRIPSILHRLAVRGDAGRFVQMKARPILASTSTLPQTNMEAPERTWEDLVPFTGSAWQLPGSATISGTLLCRWLQAKRSVACSGYPLLVNQEIRSQNQSLVDLGFGEQKKHILAVQWGFQPLNHNKQKWGKKQLFTNNNHDPNHQLEGHLKNRGTQDGGFLLVSL